MLPKLLVFLFSIFLSSLVLEAQTGIYHPFPDSAIIWREHSSGIGFNCCCSGQACAMEEDYEYFIGGDTTIGNISYYKIFRTGIHQEFIVGQPTCPPWCNGNVQYSYFNDVYAGSFREDTSHRKIYFLPPASSQDTLLYDFDLSLGDTLPAAWNNSPSFNYVTTIDSVMIGNVYHKRFWISNQSASNYVAIIEGIGSTFGLLSELIDPFEFYYSLQCVTVNSLTVFPDTNTDCPFVSTANEISPSIHLSIFPNPFHSYTTLHLFPPQEKYEFRIFNLLGMEVVRQQIISGSALFNREGLVDGLYILSISNEKGYFANGKLIVN